MDKAQQDRLAYVGRSVGRIGGRDLVRGRSVFAEDDQPEGALILKAFRSERHHARILSIDTAKARKVPGIAGILTAADIPGVNQYGVIIKDQPLLAKDKVRFGEADLTNLRKGAGFGVRVEVPMMGTIGFDYGYGFDRVGGPSWEPHFNIGSFF